MGFVGYEGIYYNQLIRYFATKTDVLHVLLQLIATRFCDSFKDSTTPLNRRRFGGADRNAVQSVHGAKAEVENRAAFQGFADGRVAVLVTTDAAARLVGGYRLCLAG